MTLKRPEPLMARLRAAEQAWLSRLMDRSAHTGPRASSPVGTLTVVALQLLAAATPGERARHRLDGDRAADAAGILALRRMRLPYLALPHVQASAFGASSYAAERLWSSTYLPATSHS